MNITTTSQLTGQIHSGQIHQNLKSGNSGTTVTKNKKKRQQQAIKVLQQSHASGVQDRMHGPPAIASNGVPPPVTQAGPEHHVTGVNSLATSKSMEVESEEETLDEHTGVALPSTTPPSFLSQVIWLRTLLAELNCPQHNPTELMVDNLSAVKMSNRKDAGKSDMRKHILAKYYWLREQVNTGTIAVTWLPTGQELADIFTKPLGPQLFNEFKPVIMGTAYDNPHFILKQ